MLARVQEAVARTGYVPNRVAGGLASSRSRLVAAIVPDHREPDVPGDGAGAHRSPRGRGLPGDARRERLRRHARGRAARRDHRPAARTASSSPASCTRPRGAGACWPRASRWSRPGTSRPRPSTCWWASPTRRRAAAAGLPAPCGARGSAMICGRRPRAGLRRQGFAEAAARLGIGQGPRAARARAHHHRRRTAALAALLDRHPTLDAVYCSSDLLALGALIEARRQGPRGARRLRMFGLRRPRFRRRHGPAAHHPARRRRRHRPPGGALPARPHRRRPEGPRIVDLGFTIVPRDERLTDPLTAAGIAASIFMLALHRGNSMTPCPPQDARGTAQPPLVRGGRPALLRPPLAHRADGLSTAGLRGQAGDRHHQHLERPQPLPRAFPRSGRRR